MARFVREALKVNARMAGFVRPRRPRYELAFSFAGSCSERLTS